MASRNAKRPNVLFILSDDQGPWAMGCAGNKEIITPALDGLAARGMRFENFFCVSPVCSPARASLLTGEIPSQHGVHDWIRDGNVGPTRIDYLEGKTLITDVALTAGYRCGLVGKWHLGASDAPRPGFVNWYAHQSGMSAYFDAPMVEGDKLVAGEGYLTEDLTDRAIGFLGKEADRPEPFWLALNYTAPHYPWINSHPKRYTDLYADCAFDSCPIEPPHRFNAGGNPATDEGNSNRRDSLVGYYAATTAMDMGIAKVVEEIERLGLTRSTLVIFMSDNGMNCGHHGIWGKGNGTRPQNMYDTSVKVPCIFTLPGRIPAGIVSERLISAYDVFPTLHEYLGFGTDTRSGRPGTSFRATLDGVAEGERGPVVVFDEYGPVRMIRTRDWKYVHRDPAGPHELYDLTADPDERHDLIDDPRHAGMAAELRGQLTAWFDSYVDPVIDGRKWGVTGAGQLGRTEAGVASEKRFATVPIAALKKEA
jgi:arylsulfatase A-like enzyme